MDGFLVIDKPAGWTSHDVVARTRRLAGQKRVGHTGTLDPDATGVLLVCLGFATRLIEYTSGHRKRYVASLALGIETDSQDASGAVLQEQDAAHITLAMLRATLPRFTGDILQTPPMVSAVHHNGERLYDIARRGEVVERAARPVTIHRLEALDFTPGRQPTATLEVECSAGTYIRTLCHDIGAALGTGGMMAVLRRTAVGPFTEHNAHPLAALEEAAGTLERLIRPSVELLPPEWPRLEGTEEDAEHIRHGRPLPESGHPESGDAEWAVFQEKGRLRALLRRGDGLWKPVKVFPA